MFHWPIIDILLLFLLPPKTETTVEQFGMTHWSRIWNTKCLTHLCVAFWITAEWACYYNSFTESLYVPGQLDIERPLMTWVVAQEWSS